MGNKLLSELVIKANLHYGTSVPNYLLSLGMRIKDILSLGRDNLV